MNKSETTALQLEILVSTVNRTSLDFLDTMFQNTARSDYHILIINQTTPNTILNSNDPNIRVINSFEKGLSKSRNLAIKNSVGDICLLADDDVVYLEGFEKHIMQSYQQLQDADIITFKTLTTDNKPFSKYPKQTVPLGGFCKYVLSIELSFRRSSIVNSTVRFNEHFGLGATFQDSENYIFLLEVMKQNHLKSFFVPEYIVIHKPLSSSDEIYSDRLIFARSALNYKIYGNAAYIYVLKLMVYLLRHDLIDFKDVQKKFKVAHQGIRSYKRLKSNEREEQD